jgi:hypothetical protein
MTGEKRFSNNLVMTKHMMQVFKHPTPSKSSELTFLKIINCRTEIHLHETGGQENHSNCQPTSKINQRSQLDR